MKNAVIILLCAAYVLSHVDLMPEIALGPIGAGDDLVAGIVGLRALFGGGKK